MIYAAAGASVPIQTDGFGPGLVGTIGYEVVNSVDAIVTARTTAGITVDTQVWGSVYNATLVAPALMGSYTIVWDDGAGRYAREALYVSFTVPTGSDLCTLTDVRQSLEIPTSDTSRDALMQTLISQASQAIMNDYNREFAPATASATRRLRVDGWLVNLEPYDLRTVETMTLHPESASPQTLTAVSDYQLQPWTAEPSGGGTFTSVLFSNYLTLMSDTLFRFGYALVDITGAWGFATVPLDVQRACVLTVSSWMRRDVTALALASADFITDRGLSPSLPSSFAIPNDARRLLQPYERLSTLIA